MRFFAVLCLVLSVITASLSAWLFYSVVPKVAAAAASADEELTRNQASTDALMAQGLAEALFTRDYGTVQDLLARYAEVGYLTRAAVTNREQLVIASVGSLPLKIGSKLQDEVAAGLRRIPLSLRSERFGELLVASAAASSRPAADRDIGMLRNTSAALAAISIVAAVALTSFVLLRK
jgi:hypothetical protein